MKVGYYRRLDNPTGLAAIDLLDYYGKGYLITRVSVPPAHRRKGIATDLLKEVLLRADKGGIDLYLEVASWGAMNNHDLKTWYGKNGFVEISTNMMMRKFR